MEHFANSPVVASRLRQWQSVKTVIKITLRYSVLRVAVLLVFHDNFMEAFYFFFVFWTHSSLLVQSNPQGVY